MTRDVSDVTHRKRRLRFEKSQWVELSSVSEEEGWLLLARSPRPCGGCHTWFGADGKVVIERWYHSPYIEKPLNSKVIKSFVPELRSRKCFCVSGFLCSMYICYEDSRYISYIHVWLCYSSGCFCQGRENDQRHWTVRYTTNWKQLLTRACRNHQTRSAIAVVAVPA